MIILIGGMSHTGKTLLAQKLLQKFGITYLCLDHLKMGLCRGLDEKTYSPMQDYRVLGEKLWPIVKGIIMTNVENRQNIIIEGCYILPHLADDFDEEYKKEIMTIFLGFSPQYIRNNYNDIIVNYASVIEDRGEIFGEPFDTYAAQTTGLKAECIKAGSKYFEIEEDYLKEIGKVIDYIGNQIDK